MFGDFNISSAGMQSAQRVTKMDAARSRGQQSRIKEVDTYRAERAKFFENLKKDQLGVETILLNEVTRDFEKNRWRNIEAAFYNVQLNGRKWDGITVRFGNDKNDRGRYGDHLRVEQGKSSPDAFDQSAYNRSFTNNTPCSQKNNQNQRITKHTIGSLISSSSATTSSYIIDKN